MRLIAASILGWCVMAGTAQEGDSRRLAAHGRILVKILEKTKDEAEFVGRVRAVLRDERAADFPERFHKLLESRCLIRVTINPESRVKAVRGEAPARLRRDAETVFLVRVQNEAGVTHPLRVSVRGGAGKWLKTQAQAVSAKGLSGAVEEYVILRLSAPGAGKREATLTFDVGQGTQDLGFRAEVPVLFTVD